MVGLDAHELVSYEYLLLPERRCVRVDTAVEELLGYAVEDFLSRPSLLFDIVHPQDRRDFFTLLAGDAEDVCIRWMRRDGSSVWCRHTVSRRLEGDQLTAVVGTARRIAPPPGRCGRVHPPCERLGETF